MERADIKIDWNHESPALDWFLACEWFVRKYPSEHADFCGDDGE